MSSSFGPGDCWDIVKVMNIFNGGCGGGCGGGGECTAAPTS